MPQPQKYRDVAEFLRSQGWAKLREAIRQITAAFPETPRNWR